MSTTIQANTTRRTPDEIALDLTMYRNRIRADLETVTHESDNKTSATISFKDQLIRTIASAQRYFTAYVGEGGAHFTSVTALDFAKKNPLITGLVATAVVGIVAATGPKRIISWVTKVVAIWRVSSALRH